MSVSQPPEDEPIGRRVARWRDRRRMTQQMLADRLGKSKSWVDKVERGVRSLDRFSVIQDVAGVLRVDVSVLTGAATRPAVAGAIDEDVDRVRAALARYDFLQPGPPLRAVPPVGELDRQVTHAWLSYQRAHYPQLMRMLPGLLGDAQRAHATQGEGDLLIQVYRITASVLVKLGEADLAWLAADRAMAAASGDPLLAAAAAIPLGQALRAAERGRLAMSATATAAHRIAPTVPQAGAPPELALCGTLLVEAALAAASCGDARGAGELLAQAGEIAERVDGSQDHHHTGFGSTSVRLARVTAAVDLDDGGAAVAWHEKAVGASGWSLLPVEHRAAHLVDAARAYLHVGDLLRAGRALVDAERTAPAEIRYRPAAHAMVEFVASVRPVAAGVARLASLIGLTR
ncbi:helix-turn-helix domain-containing protein [Micromonospora sp. DT233]|uniref:helix-turn-helix domain-containing protein n=1 Tax=Micromonospora sp. DT233 TaxID=3393432 RepID=UPI003CF6DBE9